MIILSYCIECHKIYFNEQSKDKIGTEYYCCDKETRRYKL